MLRRIVFLLVLLAVGPAFAGSVPNAAHDLAQKFSGQAEAAKPAVSTGATSEPVKAKSLDAAAAKPAPAKSEAAPAQRPTVKPFATTAADAAASEAATPKISNSERPPIDYEMDMLRRARAEQADRKAADKAVSPAAAPAKIVVHPPVVEPKPIAEAKPEAAPPPLAAPAAAPSKPAEAEKIVAPAQAPPAQKIEPQKLVEAPAAPKTTAAAPSTAAPAAAAAATVVAAPASGPTAQASVLLAIETGGASTKSSDATTYDPIICVADTCFLSAGLTADAVKLSKVDALKLKSSNDASPDACRGKVACVFRNVALPKDALIQVVELGGATADPERTYAAEPDTSCKSSEGALACDNPIATADFRIWIVPEATAKTAGVDAIEDAVAESLPHRDIARDTDK